MTEATNAPRALNIRQAARWFSARGIPTSSGTVRRWIDDGLIAAHTVGKRQLIDEAELEAMLASTPWGTSKEARS